MSARKWEVLAHEAMSDAQHWKRVARSLQHALTDAEFLLRRVGTNWREAGAMADSCQRCACDARAALIESGRKEQ